MIEPVRITEFQGLITNIDDTNVPRSMSIDCRNVRPKPAGLKSRGGHEKVNITSYNEPIREIFVIPMVSGFFGNQAGGGIGSGAGGGGTGAGAGGSGGGDTDETGSDGGGDIIIIVEDDGDAQENPTISYVWCKVPVDDNDHALFPHVQIDDLNDMSGPWLDAESKTNQAYWTYADEANDWKWEALPSGGIPTAIMNRIRLYNENWRVRYSIPSDLAGITRGLNWIRFRFWDGYEYSAWVSQKNIYL